MKTIFLFIALSIAFHTPVQAQDHAKQEAILKLLEVTGMQGMISKMAKGTFTQTFNSLGKKNPNLTQDHMKIIKDEAFKIFDESTPMLTAQFATIYEKRFSLEEINAIIAFNQTEVGKKINKLTPEITMEGMKAGQIWMRQILPQFVDRLKKRLGKDGIELNL